jgi:formylglycine-generating enzyme required for sulfatase activity
MSDIRCSNNSLGLEFVPAGTDGVLFCKWLTRLQDYQVFVEDTGHGIEAPGFEQGPDHPAVNVSWEDAQQFCQWLTRKERTAGVISSSAVIRLPTDHEWSVAVGIGDRENPNVSPKRKDGQIPGIYPWGTAWPPPAGAGNFAGAERPDLDPGDLKDYNDGFPYTSPVGSFQPNVHGLYDMAGNVHEWVEDTLSFDGVMRVMRGGSWYTNLPPALISSRRDAALPNERSSRVGFRCVLVMR